ncbi:MAG: competence protein [Rikenellaceae bacterium]
MKSMRYKIMLVFAAFFVVLIGSVKASEPAKVQVDTLWQRANAAYSAGDYQKAVEEYEQIMNMGYESSKLYYNKANSYFKLGNVGKSIVNYKRAERLAPGDTEIAHNLKIAEAQTKNRIEQLPEFFLKSFYRDVKVQLSSNGWAFLSIAMFALLFSAAMFYLLSNTPFKRKIGFTIATIALSCFIVSLIFSVERKNEIVASDVAVIVSSAEAVKSSPDNNGKDIFIINEGAVVTVIDKIGNWSEIMVASGNRGWVQSKAIEVI